MAGGQQPEISEPGDGDVPHLRPGADAVELTGQRPQRAREPGSARPRSGAPPSRATAAPAAPGRLPDGSADGDEAETMTQVEASPDRELERRVKVVVDTLRDMRFREPRRVEILVFVMALCAQGRSIEDALALREARHFDGRGVAPRELKRGLSQVTPALRGLADDELREVWSEVARRFGY